MGCVPAAATAVSLGPALSCGLYCHAPGPCCFAEMAKIDAMKSEDLGDLGADELAELEAELAELEAA